MHNVRTENVQEHSLQVAMVAHALALIKNKFFGGFHDVSEVLTGDYYELFNSVKNIFITNKENVLISVEINRGNYAY